VDFWVLLSDELVSRFADIMSTHIPDEIREMLESNIRVLADEESSILERIGPDLKRLEVIRSKLAAAEEFLSPKGSRESKSVEMTEKVVEPNDDSLPSRVLGLFDRDLKSKPLRPKEIADILELTDSDKLRHTLSDLHKYRKLARRYINGNTYEYHRPEAFKLQNIEPKEIPKKKAVETAS
jgi:hypothetical protein